jgi:cyclopropane fatty-acyl-phospholipid synthase-like methyltransferase
MKYPKTEKYNISTVNKKIMGPNPLKLEEELMKDNCIKKGAIVMDLGSGQGITSVFLAKEYGFQIYATDLWSEAQENQKFFAEMGLTDREIIAVKADATNLTYEHEFFDAVVSTDSYNYFGRDAHYLDEKLLPFVKAGGYVYIVVPGMKKDCHNDIPSELLLSWTPEQLDYIHDIEYWKSIISKSEYSEVVSIYEMNSNEECWNDWIQCDNEYAINDKKAIEAGACKYLNFIAIVLKKKQGC